MQLSGLPQKRDLRVEVRLLAPGHGMCLGCVWRPDLYSGVPVDKQCQDHTAEAAHPTTFQRERPAPNPGGTVRVGRWRATHRLPAATKLRNIAGRPPGPDPGRFSN